VLATAEPFLLGSGNRTPVNDESGGRVVEDRVDAEYYAMPFLPR
jgi:hypothetical protein